jgi:hypothetical protein
MLPPPPLRLLPAGTTVAGWELHPLKIDAFARRTMAHLSAEHLSAESVPPKYKVFLQTTGYRDAPHNIYNISNALFISAATRPMACRA